MTLILSRGRAFESLDSSSFVYSLYNIYNLYLLIINDDYYKNLCYNYLFVPWISLC